MQNRDGIGFFGDSNLGQAGPGDGPFKKETFIHCRVSRDGYIYLIDGVCFDGRA